jgi:hypothetical protein
LCDELMDHYAEVLATAGSAEREAVAA